MHSTRTNKKTLRPGTRAVFGRPQLALPVVTVCGKAVWIAREFLVKHVVTPPISKLKPADVGSHCKSFARQLAASFPSRVRSLNLQVSTWTVHAEAVFQAGVDGLGSADIRARSKLVRDS